MRAALQEEGKVTLKFIQRSPGPLPQSHRPGSLQPPNNTLGLGVLSGAMGLGPPAEPCGHDNPHPPPLPAKPQNKVRQCRTKEDYSRALRSDGIYLARF